MLLSQWCNLCSCKCCSTTERGLVRKQRSLDWVAWFCFVMLSFLIANTGRLVLRPKDSTPLAQCSSLRKFTSSTNYFIGPAMTGMKADWLSSSYVYGVIFSTCFHSVCLFNQLPTPIWTRTPQGLTQRGRAAPRPQTTPRGWSLQLRRM